MSARPSHRGVPLNGGYRALRVGRSALRCRIGLLGVLPCLCLLGALGFTPLETWAADRDIVITLDIQAPGLERGQSEQVIARFRDELGRTGRFSLLDRTEMNNELAKLGYPRGDGCENIRCFAPLTRDLGVSKIVSARMDREGDAFALSAQWIEVGQSATVRSTALPLPLGSLAEVLSRGTARLAAQVASLASGSPAGNATEPSSSNSGAKPWLEKGFALRQSNGEYQPPELAAYEFSKAVFAEPNNATAHAARGEVYLQLQQYSDALSDYDQAIRLEPRRGSHYYGRALVHEAMRQGALMCADLRRACELGDPAGCNLARRRGC